MIQQTSELDWLFVLALCSFNLILALILIRWLIRLKNRALYHILIAIWALIGIGCGSWLLIGNIFVNLQTWMLMPTIQQAVDEGCAGRNLTATFSLGNTWYSTSGQIRWDSVDEQIACYQDINSWVCTCK